MERILDCAGIRTFHSTCVIVISKGTDLTKESEFGHPVTDGLSRTQRHETTASSIRALRDHTCAIQALSIEYFDVLGATSTFHGRETDHAREYRDASYCKDPAGHLSSVPSDAWLQGTLPYVSRPWGLFIASRRIVSIGNEAVLTLIMSSSSFSFTSPESKASAQFLSELFCYDDIVSALVKLHEFRNKAIRRH